MRLMNCCYGGPGYNLRIFLTHKTWVFGKRQTTRFGVFGNLRCRMGDFRKRCGRFGGFIKLPLAHCFGGSVCRDGELLNSAGPPPSSLLFKCRAKRPDKKALRALEAF